MVADHQGGKHQSPVGAVVETPDLADMLERRKTALVNQAPSTHDPQPTKAPSKSRSAVGLPQWYLALQSTGEIAGETARFHHAARRRGGVAGRGARAAAGDAGDRVLERRIVGGTSRHYSRIQAGPH